MRHLNAEFNLSEGKMDNTQLKEPVRGLFHRSRKLNLYVCALPEGRNLHKEKIKQDIKEIKKLVLQIERDAGYN